MWAQISGTCLVLGGIRVTYFLLPHLEIKQVSLLTLSFTERGRFSSSLFTITVLAPKKQKPPKRRKYTLKIANTLNLPGG